MAFLEARNLHKTYRLSRHNVVAPFAASTCQWRPARWWG